jgi:hypothetical protein
MFVIRASRFAPLVLRRCTTLLAAQANRLLVRLSLELGHQFDVPTLHTIDMPSWLKLQIGL